MQRSRTLRVDTGIHRSGSGASREGAAIRSPSIGFRYHARRKSCYAFHTVPVLGIRGGWGEAGGRLDSCAGLVPRAFAGFRCRHPHKLPHIRYPLPLPPPMHRIAALESLSAAPVHERGVAVGADLLREGGELLVGHAPPYRMGLPGARRMSREPSSRNGWIGSRSSTECSNWATGQSVS